MLSSTDLHLKLSRQMVTMLRSHAKVRGLSEATIVEQALNQFFAVDESPVVNDYWFSVGTLKEDWDEMPEDWMASETPVR